MNDPQTFEDIIKLPSMPLSRHGRKGLPQISAVYIVYSFKHGILYIGASKRLRQRWFDSHHHGILIEVPKMRIAWIPTERAELAALETKLIRRFDPLMNFAVKRGAERNIRVGCEFFGLPGIGSRRSSRPDHQRTFGFANYY